MKTRLRIVLIVGLLAALALLPFRRQVIALLRGEARPATVAERLRAYGPRARARWKPHFDNARLTYPPAKVVLLGIKDTEVIEVYGAGKDGRFRFVCVVPVLAASGDLGPKLEEGDYQVPEGRYTIAYLNPNSQFHLSIMTDYPNAFDRKMAKRDGRRKLGGDIAIHGAAVSVGCLAVGDEAAEDLFVLAADTGISRVSILLTPTDFRTAPVETRYSGLPVWVPALYRQLRHDMKKLPAATNK